MSFEKAYGEYARVFGGKPECRVFTPYRVCPVGAHVDHQWGKISGLAIDKGVALVYTPTEDGSCSLRSVNFAGPAEWNLNAIPEKKVGDWADHLRGAAAMLRRVCPLKRGLKGVMEGELPVGGLSSSAAVILTFLTALCRLNGITLSSRQRIDLAQQAENEYVGVSCGKLDQSCEVLCRKDMLLYLDTKDDSFESIPTAAEMKPYVIGIFFSGLERSLAGSAFNMRVDECKAASYALKAFAGMEYGKYADSRLRDVPEEVFRQYADRLPENWRRRAAHFYGENARVTAGAEAWRKGDLETFGEIVFESGRSSIELYQTGSPELKALYDSLRRTDGVYGGRFSGAGFKGCCMALLDPDKADSVLETVKREYLARFPALEEKYTAALCCSADGVAAMEED